MRRLQPAPNLAIGSMWVDMLRQAGVSASLQRQFLSSAAGELPPDQCLPEVWITDDAQFEQARRLLDQILSAPQRRWHCACGELVEGGFESCWSCGRPMP